MSILSSANKEIQVSDKVTNCGGVSLKRPQNSLLPWFFSVRSVGPTELCNPYIKVGCRGDLSDSVENHELQPIPVSVVQMRKTIIVQNGSVKLPLPEASGFPPPAKRGDRGGQRPGGGVEFQQSLSGRPQNILLPWLSPRSLRPLCSDFLNDLLRSSVRCKRVRRPNLDHAK